MKTISKVFLRGLAAILPVALTIYIVYWLLDTGEELFGGLLKKVVPGDGAWYQRGYGLLLTLCVILLVGVLMNAYLGRKLYAIADKLLARTPVVKGIYGMLKDVTRFFATPDQKGFDQVVMVQLSATARMIGFVTRDTFDDLPAGIGGRDTVAVYMPMSYQLGGFLAMLPRTAVEPVDMSMQEALRFAVTAGMSTMTPKKQLALQVP